MPPGRNRGGRGALGQGLDREVCLRVDFGGLRALMELNTDLPDCAQTGRRATGRGFGGAPYSVFCLWTYKTIEF